MKRTGQLSGGLEHRVELGCIFKRIGIEGDQRVEIRPAFVECSNPVEIGLGYFAGSGFPLDVCSVELRDGDLFDCNHAFVNPLLS